jgi:hypothetical protein
MLVEFFVDERIVLLLGELSRRTNPSNDGVPVG